jgi:hypothetical protein
LRSTSQVRLPVMPGQQQQNPDICHIMHNSPAAAIKESR